jgi:hypothetical protein
VIQAQPCRHVGRAFIFRFPGRAASVKSSRIALKIPQPCDKLMIDQRPRKNQELAQSPLLAAESFNAR